MVAIYLTHEESVRTMYYGEKALAGLAELGELRVNDTGAPLTTEQLIAEAEGCQVIVSYRQTEAPAALFEALPELVAFVRCAVDIRNVDVGAASAQGVLVTQASPGFIASVSELVIGMMVDLGRRVSDAVLAYRGGTVPAATMGRQLAGSTVGIIGYGVIGAHLAQLTKALAMRVLVSDPHVAVDDPALGQVDLPTLLQQSDFVICLAIAIPATENLLDDAAFRLVKPGAFFINVSRGNLVDEAALQAALDDGRLAGAAMDVGRAPDQMPSPGLASHPKVIATPHVGGLTPDAIAHQALESVSQVRAIVTGRAPPGAVNQAQANRLSRLE
jgi:D-3-phosphoglycerate dehydrogenase